MTWTVALPEGGGAGLRALVDGRTILPAEQADVVLWPARRRGAMPVGTGLNVIDVRGADPSESFDVTGAGLLLVGSAAAFGAWAAHDVPIGVVPPAIAAAATASERFEALHLLVGPGEADAATRAAGWAAARGMPCGVAEGPLELVDRIGPTPPLGPGAVVLDLRTGVGRIDASPALLGLLAAGAPMLFGEDTPLRSTLEGVGAAWRFETIEAGLEHVAGLGPATFGRASGTALAFVAARFGEAAAVAAFERAVDAALTRARARAAAWERLGPGGHVLVVSDEGANLRDVRVHLPFDALLRRGAIEGYSVLHRGEFAFSTRPVTAQTRFSAIWVQRSVDPLVQLFLRVLDRTFIYDLDDHLLVSPLYRPPFAAEALETAAGLVRDCRVLSCATARLAASIGDTKAIVTPNLAYAPMRRAAGPARAVVWASSDAPALLKARAAVEAAIRDFCRAHRLPILCIGVSAPAAFVAAGITIETVEQLPYPAYLARLAAATPGILVAPLETDADPATQAFVDAKSDIKIMEARLAGLQGVFSRAPAYAESDLLPEILCENSYAGWLDGLERARLACEQPGPAMDWPARRDGAGIGPMPWAEALCRAPVDVSAQEVTAALRFVRAQGQTLLGTPEAFDEADYLRRHPDVADAVATGVVASGYRHFVQSGFGEGRAARRLTTPQGDASFWWTRLLHQVSGLEADVAARRQQIAGLRDRLTVRRLLPDAAAPPPPAADADDGRFRWSGGEPRSLPCPVCAAPGPHPLVVSAGSHVLVRCERCGTCFYEDRAEHAYAAEPGAAVALQFALEQNAGIHHQTRLLFGRAGARSVLDVGCGFGFAVDLAEKVLGLRAVGVDPSWSAAAGREQLGADIRQDYLTAALDLGDPFDRVIASEVIEHVTDPYAMLALLRERLAPGGVLALTTPNAAAIQPGADEGRLLGILAPGVHLTLFTKASLALALRKAGFGHVAVQATADTLVAEASDWPLQPSAEAEHAAAYRAYVGGLMVRAPVGSALWNGSAGRLLRLLVPTAPPETLDALFGEIGAAWVQRFGIDPERLGLPAPLPEAEIASIGAAALGTRQPFNLAGVLLDRALMAERNPGRDPRTVLGYAEAAYRIAVETRRVLQAEHLVDLDLKRTAWQARLLVTECAAELAPGLRAELLAAVAAPSPGKAADWVDPPSDAVIALVAGCFADTVAADRFDEARRVEAWVADADAVVSALAGQPELLLRTLFMRGVQRLVGHRDPAGAMLAFERLSREASRLGAADYQAVAAEHMALAAQRMEESSAAR